MVKIINQCLHNYCDQQLISTYRGYYNITANAAYYPFLPAEPIIATVLQVPAFHAPVLLLRGSKRHLGPAIPPCATCELLPPWLPSCGWPCTALSQSLHFPQGWTLVWHFKALSYGLVSALHVGPNTPRGSLAPPVDLSALWELRGHLEKHLENALSLACSPQWERCHSWMGLQRNYTVYIIH